MDTYNAGLSTRSKNFRQKAEIISLNVRKWLRKNNFVRKKFLQNGVFLLHDFIGGKIRNT